MTRHRHLALVAALLACRAPASHVDAGARVAVYVTTGDQTHLLARDTVAASADASLPTVVVDDAKRFQTVVGWGAAMSDASAYLIERAMSASQRESLVRELFGAEPGIGLSFVRVPMGASDFSRTHYSYDDVPAGETDPTLARFSIAPDRAEKIPALRRARAQNPRLTLVGSPWSAPGWMKTSGSLIKGSLKPEHYGAFAEYLRRWIAAYESEGLPVFALTLQNEPHFEPGDYPGMRLDPAQRATLFARHVGPLFARHGVRTQLWDWDHNWDDPGSPRAVLADPAAKAVVSGVAWHCYGGDVTAEAQVRDEHPDEDVYFTECSGGDWAPVWADNLKWNVSKLVIGNARAWARGVALWNLALDEHHGPHLGGCKDCRGVVTIHSTTGAVTRNPEYYALAHASRFVRPGAVRIESTQPAGLETVAFRNADDASTALLVLNPTAAPVSFAVRAGSRAFIYAIPASAVTTFVWK